MFSGGCSRAGAASGLALWLWAGFPFGPQAHAATASETEARLRELSERIEQATHTVTRDAVERDRLSRALRDAELASADARRQLSAVQSAQREHGARRAQLATERVRQQASLASERDSLASQLRVAYLLGRTEPLKLLLNQQDPLRAGRMFSYYGYFGRARARQLALIAEKVQALTALEAQLTDEDLQLEALRAQREQQLRAVELRRAERQKVLATLQASAREHSESLARLRAQRADLEKLLTQLRRSLRSLPPPDVKSAFASLRGRLDWPVSGRLIARYGERRAAQVKWEAMVVSTDRGAPVRAIASGRVVYADWLSGLGLLAIVDHGDNYLSLYGYNEQLQKRVGEQVSAGEVIASAGDSGGRPQPELYFEIRRDGQPVNPQAWFRNPSPPRD